MQKPLQWKMMMNRCEVPSCKPMNAARAATVAKCDDGKPSMFQPNIRPISTSQ